MQRTPSASPSSSLPLSGSRMAGSTPKKGSVAEPGFSAQAPGRGVIMWPPVSVCHHVSTIGQLPSPTTSSYHRHASGFIGSPTVPRICKHARLFTPGHPTPAEHVRPPPDPADRDACMSGHSRNSWLAQ